MSKVSEKKHLKNLKAISEYKQQFIAQYFLLIYNVGI